MNTHAKGRYYVAKTITWLEEIGYVVAPCEWISARRIGKRPIYTKRDLWASDLVARSEHSMVFVQVKAYRGDLSKAAKAYRDLGAWPPGVSRWVVIWQQRSRSKTPDLWEITVDGKAEMLLRSAST